MFSVRATFFFFFRVSAKCHFRVVFAALRCSCIPIHTALRSSQRLAKTAFFKNSIVFSSSLFGQELSLDQAKELAKRHSLEIEKHQNSFVRFDHQKAALAHGYYPTLSLSYGKTQSLDDPEPHFYFTPGVSAHWEPKNPWQYTQEKEQTDLKKSLFELDGKIFVRDLELKVEKLYQSLQLLSQKQAHGKQIFAMTEQSFDAANVRYKKGFLSRTDLDLLEIETLSQKLNLNSSQKQYEHQKELLADLLGLSLKDVTFSSKEKPWLQKNLIEQIKKSETFETTILNQKIESNRMDEEILSFQRWPTLSLDVNSSWPQRQGKVKHQTSMTLTLNWQIFDGLSYMDQRQKLIDQRDDLKQDQKILERDQEQKKTSLIRDFLSYHDEYQSYEELQKRRLKLLEDIKKRFIQGQISSEEIANQSKDYLTSMTKLFDLEINMMNVYFDLLSLTL